MSKKQFNFKREGSVYKRAEFRTFYENKFFSLWMNKFKAEGIDDEQMRFVMREFWRIGKVACFKLKGSEGATGHPQGVLVFTPFAPCQFNIYDEPVYCNLINKRAVPFIPASMQEVNKDVVLGYASRTRRGIFELIEPLIDELVDCEMVIRINLAVQKTPWIFAISPDDRVAVTRLLQNLQNDEFELFVESDAPANIKALTSGAPFVLDKLYQYKQARENEIKEILGLNNLGTWEKKEHLITSEVEVNDEIIDQSDKTFLDCIDEFTDRIYEVFGISVKFRLNETPKPEATATDNQEEKGVEDTYD